MPESETFREILSSAPEMQRWYVDGFYSEVFYGGSVPVRIKELVRLRLSQIHGCAT